MNPPSVPSSSADPAGSPQPKRSSRELAGIPLLLLVASLNHLLEQQAWARDRLLPYAGRQLRLAIDSAFPLAPLLPEVLLRIDAGGLLSRPEFATEGPADVSLWIRPSASALLAGLRQGADGLSGHLRIEGDVGLATVLGELARQLRWDVEEDLSRILGDAGAHRLSETARELRQRAAADGDRVVAQARQWLTHEDPMLVEAAEFGRWRDELAELGRRVDRLASRLR